MHNAMVYAAEKSIWRSNRLSGHVFRERCFSGKGKGTKRIHDDIDPQHLYHRYRIGNMEERSEHRHADS